ncbi:MAG TPA: prolyl oligopeptidase family serine peptidase [Acidimicrobiales bacterium]|nr:prolyl oligopeptidase family serine peptidase [Acidimicrobiales bacterium]
MRDVEEDEQAQGQGPPQEGQPRAPAQRQVVAPVDPARSSASLSHPLVRVPPAPPTRRDDVVDVLHGRPVSDPYRWLEDGDSAETAAWTDAQNARTRAVLDALPFRPALHARFLELLRMGSVGAPAVGGDRVFALQREGDQEQAVLVVRSARDPDEPPRVLVDPADLAADHAAAVDWFSPSPDGRLVAYGISEAGSERGTLHILDVASGELLPDALPHVRHPSPAWLPDGSAFAYSRLPDPATVEEGEEGYWETVWWHEVGRPGPEADTLVLGDLDRTALPMAAISPDGRWLALHVHLMPTRTDVVLVDRSNGDRTTVVAGEEASTWCQVVGDHLYAVTNLGASRGRVVRASVRAPRADEWETIVAESEAVIEAAVVAGEWLLVASTEHAVSRLHRYRLDGSGGAEEALPEMGSVVGLDADPATDRAFLAFTSFTRPSGLWRWTPPGGVERWSRLPSPVDPAGFVTEQVRYESTDGTRVPMFLVRAAGTGPSPDTPTVVSGYGGFAIPSTPGFSVGLVAFCEKGGVYAVPGIRGGGEYGEDWHRAGMLDRKQQVFDDFAAAADWLVANGRTSRDRLAVRGGSNGGLLVGATITQRPDLCRAAVCAVPLLDMLRYHRFLIGALWVPEYGDPEDPGQFAALAAYSPYHHVVDGTAYPATLVLAAESDSRVDPMHARKFAARLQAATSTPERRPILLRVETRAGHGQGKPAWKQADELADSWAFLLWQLGL